MLFMKRHSPAPARNFLSCCNGSPSHSGRTLHLSGRRPHVCRLPSAVSTTWKPRCAPYFSGRYPGPFSISCMRISHRSEMKSDAVTQTRALGFLVQSHRMDGFPYSARKVEHSILAVREVSSGNFNALETESIYLIDQNILQPWSIFKVQTARNLEPRIN